MVKVVESGDVFTADGELGNVTVTDTRSALRGVLEMLAKHQADMFYTCFQIVADKYGHSADEMVATIRADPRFEQILSFPVLDDITRGPAVAPAAAAEPTKKKGKWSAEAKASAAAKRAAKKAAGTPPPEEELAAAPNVCPMCQEEKPAQDEDGHCSYHCASGGGYTVEGGKAVLAAVAEVVAAVAEPPAVPPTAPTAQAQKKKFVVKKKAEA
jgi:hypothetical protein